MHDEGKIVAAILFAFAMLGIMAFATLGMWGAYELVQAIRGR